MVPKTIFAWASQMKAGVQPPWQGRVEGTITITECRVLGLYRVTPCIPVSIHLSQCAWDYMSFHLLIWHDVSLQMCIYIERERYITNDLVEPRNLQLKPTKQRYPLLPTRAQCVGDHPCFRFVRLWCWWQSWISSTDKPDLSKSHIGNCHESWTSRVLDQIRLGAEECLLGIRTQI